MRGKQRFPAWGEVGAMAVIELKGATLEVTAGSDSFEYRLVSRETATEGGTTFTVRMLSRDEACEHLAKAVRR